MRNILISILALAALFMTSCDRVAPNYQGVLMENFGKDGKKDFSLVKGRVWTLAPGTELFQVPLFEQRAGFENHMTLKAADNTEFRSAPTYSYKVIEAQSVDVVFDNKQIGGTDFMSSLENNILEPKVYDIMKEISRSYMTDSLMASGGSLKYERNVETVLKEEFRKRGLELINFSCQLTFSDKVTEKIDSRNEVNTNISVIDQKIIEQRKRNELAELEAQEYIIRSKGLTPQILEEKKIQRWDGKLPGTYSGSSLPLMKSI